MATAFIFNLESEDGTPADPPRLKTAVPNWKTCDALPLKSRRLRVIDVRHGEPSVLVVEDCPD
jgi:hypothetical protein